MDFRLRFETVPANLPERLRDSPALLERELHALLKKAVIIFQNEVKARTPVDTSHLRGSVRGTFLTPLSAVVAPGVKYAECVEFGTRPHWPPFEPLLLWVRRKLGPQLRAGPRGGRSRRGGRGGDQEALLRSVTRAIQVSISRRGTSAYALRTLGTKGFRMFERGFLAGRPAAEALLAPLGNLMVMRLNQ